MNAPSVVAPERLYRVLSGRLMGQVFPESEVCICDEQLGGCDGRGTLVHPVLGTVTCPDCDGVGFVLGYPDVGPPHRLQLVEEAAEAVRL